MKDVFQGRCRVGQFSQSYSPQTAGTWTPGNFLVDVYSGMQLIANKVQAPTQCGTVGTHKDLTTVSFSVTYFNGFDANGVGLPDRGFWKRQIHLFIRNGTETTRLLDNAYGSSNNLADLYLYLLNNDNRTAAVQIDRESMVEAARFMDANGLYWNGILSEPASIGDWMSKIGPYFLVRETKISGRYGLRPLLPTTSTGAIDTGPLNPKWVFDGEAIIDNSYTGQLVPADARRSYRALAAWRQQGSDGLSRMTRTTVVAYDDTPPEAPIEEHNLYQFATHELQVARAMRFAQAKRRYVTHTATVAIKAGYWDPTLGEGELIAVQLDREDVDGVSSPLRQFYWITKLTHGREGVATLELEHCPVDAQNRSLIARDVAAVTVENVILQTGDSAPNCDADSGRATDCSIPAPDQQSWTGEEVWFYGRYGRRPASGEYARGGFSLGGGSPAGPPGGAPGGGGGGGGGAPAAPLPPTGPVDPPGIPAWPGTPEGPADPPLPPTPPTSYTKYDLLQTYEAAASWVTGVRLTQITISVSAGSTAWISGITGGGFDGFVRVTIRTAAGAETTNEYPKIYSQGPEPTFGYKWTGAELVGS